MIKTEQMLRYSVVDSIIDELSCRLMCFFSILKFWGRVAKVVGIEGDSL